MVNLHKTRIYCTFTLFILTFMFFTIKLHCHNIVNKKLKKICNRMKECVKEESIVPSRNQAEWKKKELIALF